MITTDQLVRIGVSKPLAVKYRDAINDTLYRYGIDTKLRFCHFLAQILHESGMLYYTKEIASGEAYDTGQKAKNLGNTPEKDGDGQKYKGRGLIQITGLFNYRALSKTLGIDFVNNPQLLELPSNATMSAGWFWDKKGLSLLADKDDIQAITKKINGGYTHLDQRQALLVKCKSIL